MSTHRTRSQVRAEPSSGPIYLESEPNLDGLREQLVAIKTLLASLTEKMDKGFEDVQGELQRIENRIDGVPERPRGRSPCTSPLGMDPFGTAKGAAKTAGTGRVDPTTPTCSRTAAAAAPQAPGRSSTRPRSIQSRSRTRSPRRKAPKVNIPDAYDGKDKGRKAKQWWTRMMICVNFEKDKFVDEDDQMIWVLQNMEDKAADWAMPLVNQISDKPIHRCRTATRTLANLKEAFDAAFGDPDAERTAERAIYALSQKGAAANYATEFMNIQADLDWDTSALMAIFRKGLHPEVKTNLALLENQPTTLDALMSQAIRIDNVHRENEADKPKNHTLLSSRAAPKPNNPSKGPPLSDSPNYVSREEKERRKAAGLCIKCGKKGHNIDVCRSGWTGPKKEEVKKEDKGKGKEQARVAMELGNEDEDIKEEEKDWGLPTITLDKPKRVATIEGKEIGKIWHRVELPIRINDHKNVSSFLVCNTGDFDIVLGLDWLQTHQPSINWETLQFKGFPTEYCQANCLPDFLRSAMEEPYEAPKTPLEQQLPNAYHKFLGVFGEEEFKALPPHREYDIPIDLEEGKTPTHGPIYSMTPSESEALKEMIDEGLATGKIRHSKSPAGSPVMFVKKSDGSLRLVVDYRKLNSIT
ncbi:hypothetical protein FRC10_010699, partial [Ceratobasidium sp. 414]